MRKVTVFLLFSVCLLGLMSCENARVHPNNSDNKSDKGKVQRECVVPSFERINIDAACNIEFVQGDTTRVVLKGRQRDVDRLMVWTKDGTLNVGHKKVSWTKDVGGYKPVKVYVCSPDLIGLTMESASNVDVEGVLDTDTLDVLVNGAGNVDLDKVICDVFRLSLRGTGNVEVDKLTSQYSDILSQGVGNIEVGFSNSGTANCTLMGVGNICLKGNLQKLQKRVRGIGRIDTDKLVVGARP